MSDNPFSFMSVIVSYFMVAGGMVLGLIGSATLKLGGGSVGFYGTLAVGALIGGFFAARASKGSTIIEPAIGAVAVVATLVGMVMASPIGTMLWAVDATETGKVGGIMGASALGGAVVGAFISEKVFGEATQSGLPWILYTALATLGSCFLSFVIGAWIVMGKGSGGVDALATAVLIGIALGSLLSGLAAGASARVRILIPALVGSAAGTMSFVMLILQSVGQGTGGNEKALGGWLIIAAGGAILSLIGAAIGWATIGKKNAW